jgi:hypothetical protein
LRLWIVETGTLSYFQIDVLPETVSEES